MLEISDLKKKRCSFCVAKTRVLISFAVTAKLICVFVFAYADCWFSHAAAQIVKLTDRNNFFYQLHIASVALVFEPSFVYRDDTLTS